MHAKRIAESPVYFHGIRGKQLDLMVNRYNVIQLIAESDKTFTLEMQHLYKPECKFTREFNREVTLMPWVELYMGIDNLSIIEEVVRNLLAIHKPLSDPDYSCHFFFSTELDDILIIPYGLFQFLDNP